MNDGEIVSFIWGVADLIRDTFKRGEYQGNLDPPRPLEQIEADIKALEREILGTLRAVAGPEGSGN